MRIIKINNPKQVQKIKYPDGQISIKLLMDIVSGEDVMIQSRFNNYEDLMYILALTDVLRHKFIKNISLYIPYFLSVLSDRRFEENGSFDLKIVTDIINSQNYENVTICHPHSDVITALIKNCSVLPPDTFITRTVDSIKNIHKGSHEIVLVSPDAGAYKWVYKLAEKLGLNVVAANKCRVDGEVHLEFTGDVEGKICLICDDELIGGATYINLAKKLIELKCANIYLYVSHLLACNGFDKLNNLDGIYSTNSINNDKHKLVTKFGII